MVNNTNRDEIISTYTIVDYKNCGDIQGHAHYVTINGKLLVLEFEPFNFRYLSLQLIHMTVVKCPFVNTKKKCPKNNLH